MRVAAALVVDKPRGKAREQDLAMLPAKPGAHAGAAPRTGAAAQEQIGEQERDDDSRSAKAEDAPITQADLKRFVDETLQKERALAAGAPGLPAADRRAGAGGPAGLSSYSNAGLAHHPTWYDTHTGWGGSWHQNHWCYDNPQWHGPFGDPCVAYATVAIAIWRTADFVLLELEPEGHEGGQRHATLAICCPRISAITLR
jgi:hypothetical protein